MTDLSWLGLWALVFVAQHLGVTSTGLRARLVGAIGEKPYLGLYSVFAILVFVLLIRAYNAATPDILLWPTAAWLRWIPLILMPVALLLVVGGLLTRNPSTVGVVLDDAEAVPVSGVMRITRHPVQSGILIWALSHLLANGDLPSLVFFGALAVVSGWGMVLIDKRKQVVLGERWSAFRQGTSLLPFAAIAQGRQSLKLAEFGWLAPAVAVAAFVALWWGHARISGVPVGVGW